jgi:GNAT superfamily N-acetyltransferase
MSDLVLVTRACETIESYLALGNERFGACGATFIRNRATPTRYDANTITLIRDESYIDELLARAELEYAHLDYRQFHVDPLTPPKVEARLALAGYGRWSAHVVMVLEGELLAYSKRFDIREVVSGEAWQAYGLLQNLDQAEYHERLGTAPAPLNGEYLMYMRAKSPSVNTWLAYIDDQACAYLSSWPGEAGVGQIEDLFAHPGYRHRGLATALIAHGVMNVRNRGAGPVLVIADPSDTPIRMYSAMGFRPLFVARSQYR